MTIPYPSQRPQRPFVSHCDCFDFINTLTDKSVDLVLTDPPYFEILKNEAWDNQWSSQEHFVEWFTAVLLELQPKLKPNASVIFFGGIGKHGSHPLFKLILAIERLTTLTFRNFITWDKRRAYGKSHDYLFTREEIVWYSNNSERTNVTFNIPLTEQLRGYKGFNKDYPAKSEFKRVKNVWRDIPVPEELSQVWSEPELMRPKRVAQKPLPLMDRLIKTHSNEGDLIVDPFVGYGSTGISAVNLKRRFLGCEAIEEDAKLANERVKEASK